MANDEELLLAELEDQSLRLGIALTSQQLQAIRSYCLAIIDYSQHTNLVGKAEFSVLLRDHVLDSLSLLPHITSATDKSGPVKLVDVGSGAGFPGIVLAIALPDLKATLIEAAGKKCRFLEEVARILELTNRVRICPDRAEELGHHPAHRGSYNFGTARAVGTFDLSAELVMPFLKTGGRFFSQKSSAQKDDELYRAEVCLPKLGGKLLYVRDLDQSILGKSRILLVGEKVEKSPPAYPRSWIKIKSRPLVED